MVEFKPLSVDETKRLKAALENNANRGIPMHMDPVTTGWHPGQDEITDEEVINQIKSIPCHY